MKKFPLSSLLLLLLAGIALYAPPRISAQHARQTPPPEDEMPLPKGNWSVRMLPYVGDGFETQPVVVTSVTSSAAKGAAVTEVKLRNQTSSTISAVKLTWYLTTAEDRTTILRHGDSPWLSFDGGFAPGTERTTNYHVISFTRLAKELMRDGSVQGDYRIEIRAEEIQYAEGAAWKSGRSYETSFLKITYPKASLAARAARQKGRCPFQICGLYYNTTGGYYYKCDASSDPVTCLNDFTKNTCTNGICTM